MSRARTAFAFAPVILLAAETLYGVVAITEFVRTVAWVLLVEVPTLGLAIIGVQSWTDR